MIRIKGLVTFIIITLIVLIFSVFFADNLFKLAIEKTVTNIWGAKVEIKDFNLSLNPAGFVINGLSFADRTNEFKNKIELENVQAKINLLPLLGRKMIIETVRGSGLQTDTDRNTSGFIKKKRANALKKNINKEESAEANKWKSEMSAWLVDIQARAKGKLELSDVSEKDLESIKLIESTENLVKKAGEQSKELAAVDVAEIVSYTEKVLAGLQNIKIESLADIEDANKKIADTKIANDKLSKKQKIYKEKITNLNKTIVNIKTALSNIEIARSRDLNTLKKNLKIPSFNTSDIAETVFGPLLTEKFGKVLTLIDTIRKHIPEKKATTTVKKERIRGIDYEFSQKLSLPSFYLKDLYVEGTTSKVILQHLSSNPALISKSVDFKYQTEHDSLNILISRFSDKNSEIVKFKSDSFKLTETPGAIYLELKFLEQTINGSINFKGRGLLSKEWIEYLGLNNPEIEIYVKITGDKKSPKFAVNSNLDALISEHLKKELSQRYSDAEADIKKSLDEIILPRLNSLQSEFEDKENKIALSKRNGLDVLERKQTAVTDIVKEKQMAVEAFIENKKQEAENKLKKESEKQLKKLFKY